MCLLTFSYIRVFNNEFNSSRISFLERCEEKGIKGIAGIEIDCEGKFTIDTKTNTTKDYQSEVLGYFPSGSYHHTQRLLEPVIKQRKERMKIYIKNASKRFKKPEINWDDFEEFHIGLANSEKNDLVYMAFLEFLEYAHNLNVWGIEMYYYFSSSSL